MDELITFLCMLYSVSLSRPVLYSRSCYLGLAVPKLLPSFERYYGFLSVKAASKEEWVKYARRASLIKIQKRLRCIQS